MGFSRRNREILSKIYLLEIFVDQSFNAHLFYNMLEIHHTQLGDISAVSWVTRTLSMIFFLDYLKTLVFLMFQQFKKNRKKIKRKNEKEKKNRVFEENSKKFRKKYFCEKVFLKKHAKIMTSSMMRQKIFFKKTKKRFSIEIFSKSCL